MIFETSQVVSSMKLGPTAAAERMNRKNVDGQIAKPSRKANGRPRSTPYSPPSEPWWKKERNVPTPGEHVHQLVQFALEHQERRHLPQLAVLQHDRHVLDQRAPSGSR